MGVLEVSRSFKARKGIVKNIKVFIRGVWVSLLALLELAELQNLLEKFLQQ